MDTFMLTLKMQSLYGNNSKCGAKELNIKVLTDFISRTISYGPYELSLASPMIFYIMQKYLTIYFINNDYNRKYFLRSEVCVRNIHTRYWWRLK